MRLSLYICSMLKSLRNKAEQKCSLIFGINGCSKWGYWFLLAMRKIRKQTLASVPQSIIVRAKRNLDLKIQGIGGLSRLLRGDEFVNV
jgi:hypothetical protein